MASPHLPQYSPPSSSLPPACSTTTSLTTNGTVHPCLGSQTLWFTEGQRRLGWKPVGAWGLGVSGGWESWGAMGKTESYHLPRFSESREKIQVPPSRPRLLGRLPACCLWRSLWQSLFPQAWCQPCPHRSPLPSGQAPGLTASPSPSPQTELRGQQTNTGKVGLRPAVPYPIARYKACSTQHPNWAPDRALAGNDRSPKHSHIS